MSRKFKRIIKKIEKKEGVTAKEVEREMQAAIDETYKSPGLYAHCIPRNGETPTPEEVVDYVVKRAGAIKK